LQLREWFAALHEDVRTAAIPKPLVGRVLSQEKSHGKQIFLAVADSWVEEDQSHRTGPLVNPSNLLICVTSQFFSFLPHALFVFCSHASKKARDFGKQL
jgi:hypothetical protein